MLWTPGVLLVLVIYNTYAYVSTREKHFSSSQFALLSQYICLAHLLSRLFKPIDDFALRRSQSFFRPGGGREQFIPVSKELIHVDDSFQQQHSISDNLFIGTAIAAH